MNYIIDPAWFYWLNVIDTINTMILVLMILSIAGVISFGVCLYICWCDNEGLVKLSQEHKKTKRLMLISSVASLIFGILYTFCPSKETMIEMQVAKFATYQNVEWTVDSIKNAVDYIVQAIKSIK